MGKRLPRSAYGDTLYEFNGIFPIPIEIADFVNGAKISITTKGILYEGQIEDENGKKMTVYDISFWDTVMTEPASVIPTGRIPFIKWSPNRSHTLKIKMSKINNQVVELKGLTQKMVDTIISAGNVAKAFKDEDERKQALLIWRENYFPDLDWSNKDYQNEMALINIEKRLKKLRYVWIITDNGKRRLEITPQQRDEIIERAKEMIEIEQLQYGDTKDLDPMTIAGKVIELFPEIIKQDGDTDLNRGDEDDRSDSSSLGACENYRRSVARETKNLERYPREGKKSGRLVKNEATGKWERV